MKRSLKNKILINISACFITVMMILTVLLSVVISRQNRKITQSLLQNTFNIIRYTIGEKQKKLLLDSAQMATQNDMSGMVDYVTTNQRYFKYSIMKPTYLKIANSLYNTGMTANIYQSCIYGMNRELIAFSMIHENGSTVGYLYGKDVLETAQIGTDKKLAYEAWTQQHSLPVEIPPNFIGTISGGNQAVFEIIDGSLCILAKTPVIGKDYNSVTDKMEPKQVGVLVTIQKLDNDFVTEMSQLSGTQINIFGTDGLIAGTYPDYTVFDLNVAKEHPADEMMCRDLHFLNDIKMSRDSFYQAAMPIYKDSRCIAAVVSLHSKQDANAYTARIIKMMSVVYFLGLLLIAPIIILMIMRGVIKPIEKMAFVIRNITQTKDFNQTLNIESQDEIGELAKTFNQMVGDLSKTTTSIDNLNKEVAERKEKEKKLREVQEELIDASHRAGMAEVATDVLHNVGNVLNSINVSTALINETLANSEVPNLKKVADMIQKHQQDLNTFFTQDPKGRHVPSYLVKAGTLLANEQEDVLGKVSVLIEDVSHIKNIIKMQQEYAKVSGVEICTTIDQVIEDAIRINQAGLKRHEVQIVRDYEDMGEVSIDRQRVVQILVNLIGNAKYALGQNEASNRTLTIRSYRQDEKFLRIEVLDNGVGISKENLNKIFRHGFTTKENGHGFGLHSGALTAKEMHGTLSVYSEGLGHGAVFTLELPFKPAGVGALQCGL